MELYLFLLIQKQIKRNLCKKVSYTTKVLIDASLKHLVGLLRRKSMKSHSINIK